jgi:hypothetical protein
LYAVHSAYVYLGSPKFLSIMASVGRAIIYNLVKIAWVLEGYSSTVCRDGSVKHWNHFFNREMARWTAFCDVVMSESRVNLSTSPGNDAVSPAVTAPTGSGILYRFSRIVPTVAVPVEPQRAVTWLPCPRSWSKEG